MIRNIQIIHLFYQCLLRARVFAPGNPVQPNLMFVSKDR
jgi:hypothetical protein